LKSHILQDILQLT